MATIADLHNYLEKLIQEGYGERILKTNDDGFIYDITDPALLFMEHYTDKFGLFCGEINAGEFTISTNSEFSELRNP
jgi:hypothetical protein